MKSEEIKNKMTELGKWNSHNIKLVSDEDEVIWTKPGEQNGNKKLMRRTVQLIQDVFGDIKELTFLDLGSMEGLHGINLTTMQAECVTMIEGKKENHDKILFSLQTIKKHKGFILVHKDITKFDFMDKHYDVILCFGLIYLFETPEVFELIDLMYQRCNKGIIIDSVFEDPNFNGAGDPPEVYGKIETVIYDNEAYYGNWRNNDPDSYNSSLNNKKSWHFTAESLRRYLDKVGFTTVYDRAYHGDSQNKRTFVCIKGERLDKLPMEE